MNIKKLVTVIKSRGVIVTREARAAYKRYKLKGLFNYLLSLIDISLRLPFCIAKPTILNLTVIEGICNFSCKMCPPAPLDHKKEISFENFKKIFDACKYVFLLFLGGWGEPFMVKDIFKIIDYAKSKNCIVATVTNASLINEGVAKKIIESQVDCLTISFDAAEPEMFERIRQGAKFQSTIDNIKTLNRLKIDYHSEKPQLFFQITAMKENVYEIPKIVELACQLDIKTIIATPIRIFGTGLAIEEQSLTNYPELAERLFLAAHKKAKELGIDFISFDYRHHRRGQDCACKQPWRIPNILMDGTIHPCCSYYPVLGNLFKDDIKKVWNNGNFRLIRKVVKKENSICYWCLKALNELRLE